MQLHAARIFLAEQLDSDRAAIEELAAVRTTDELEAATIDEAGQLGLTVAGDQLTLEGLAAPAIVPPELTEWRNRP